jgi:hypothetical protein
MPWTCAPRRRRHGRSQPAGQRSGAHGRVAVRSGGACGCPVFDFRPASWRGFWTPEARRVLNPHASIGIYGHEPGAGQCVVRMFMRFLAPRRRDGDCLKIVVSPVRFRASPPSPFSLLIPRFCARRPAALRSRLGAGLAFRVESSVLNGPHSGVEALPPGDKAVTFARSRAPGGGRDPQRRGRAVANGLVARRPPTAAKRPRPGCTGDARRLTRRPCSRPNDEGATARSVAVPAGVGSAPGWPDRSSVAAEQVDAKPAVGRFRRRKSSTWPSSRPARGRSARGGRYAC